jgi:hypothetical protein
VKLHALPQLKVICQAIRALAPPRGQTGGHGVIGHRFEQGIVHGVEEHEGRDNTWSFGGIEPGGRDVDVNGPGHLPTGIAFLRRCSSEPRPALLPGEQPGTTAERVLE